MSRTLDPGFVFDDYTYTNLCEDGVKTVRGISGKGAANKMCEVCWEFLENPEEVPVQLRYPLYTASLVSEEEIKTVLSLVSNWSSFGFPSLEESEILYVSCKFLTKHANLASFFQADVNLARILQDHASLAR